MDPKVLRTAVIAAVLTALAIVGVYLLASRDSTPPPAKPAPVVPGGDLESGGNQLKDETPPGVPRIERLKGEEIERRRERQLDPGPLGGAQNYSCRKVRPGPSSSRGGRRVLSVKLHYTVSPNLPGTRDLYGVDIYFKRSGAGSAHRIVDFEGNCIETVPPSQKAWTQGNFNPTSYSYEIIATGRESRAQWLGSKLIKRGILAAMVRDDIQRFGLRRRLVDPAGCADQIGYTDHNRLECGNNHTDVAPAFPWDVFNRQVTQGTSASTGCASKRTKQIADKLDLHRKRRNAAPRSSERWRAENAHVASWERTARGRRAGLVVQGARARRAGKLTPRLRGHLRCRTNVLNRRITR